jgi:hypothetical protein
VHRTIPTWTFALNLCKLFTQTRAPLIRAHDLLVGVRELLIDARHCRAQPNGAA